MKKIFLFLIILFYIENANAQYNCIDSDDLYDNDGLKISYCTVSLGSDGPCQKFEVTIYISNSSNVKKDISGSRIIIKSGASQFPAAGSCLKAEDIDIPFPGQNYGYSTAMNPGYSFSKKHIVYTNGVRPTFSFYITPNNREVTGDWSEWRTTTCYPKLQYQVKKVELNNLNYQVHMYYRVKSSYSEPVQFVFDLLNGNGEKEFGDPRTVQPNQTIEFVHKMKGLIIKGIRISNAKFSNGKSLECNGNDKVDGGESDKVLVDEINSYLYQVDDNNIIKKGIIQRLERAQHNPSGSASSYSNVLKDEKENARKLVASLGKTTISQPNYDDLVPRERQLVKEIKTLEPNAKVYVWEGNLNSNQDYVIQKRKENISFLENYLEETKSNATKEQAAIEKQKEAEKEAFDSNIKKGDAAFGNKDYTEAMGHYQTAKSSTTDANNQAQAQRKYDEAFEAHKTLQRAERVANAKDQDKKEDAAYGAAATSTAGLMAMLTDRYAYKPAYFRFQAALGVDNFPLILNTDILTKSETSTSLHPTISLGFKFGFLNTRGISIHFNPSFAYGINAFNTGTSGVHVNTGVTSTLFLGRKATSKIKLFAEGGYLDRLGNLSYDLDAAAAGSSATDQVEKGEYKYSVIKYGGGLMMHFINKTALKESYIKPGMFFEKMSFSEPNSKPVMLFNLQTNIDSFIIIDFSYSKNYAIGGKMLYPKNFIPENQDFWSIKLIRQGAF
ncbi:hypothetical protein [Daejeonella sp.]|uniref:hypothetical protein n=1 Tax=Daejeonella sp. TaxID=2805397 RepID=UPI0030BADAE5